MADEVSLLADVINRGFEWVKARDRYRKILDSRRSTEDDRKKAMGVALEAAAKLEKAFIRLLSVTDGQPARKRRVAASPVDWGKLAGAISKGAGALEDALKKKGPLVEVIDTEGREVL